MINDTVEAVAENIAGILERETDSKVHRMAARLLRAFNDLYSMDWRDVNRAERIREARKQDRENGRPWNEDRTEGGNHGTGRTVSAQMQAMRKTV